MKKIFAINDRGQSLVEYVLLLSVVVSIAFAFLRFPAVKDLLGPDGKAIKQFKSVLESSYRHGYLGGSALDDYGAYNGKHESYATEDTRFFLPIEPYPE